MSKMAQASLRKRITRLWFVVLTVVLAAFTLDSFQDGLCEGDRCGETLVNDDDVGVLTNASALIERERGDTNQPSPEWLVFQKFLAIGKLGRDAIAGLLQKATPAGRLYAVILLKELDQAESTKVLNRMITQPDKVLYIRGCNVETTTVGALAKRIIKGDKLVAMSNAKDAFAQNAASIDKTGNTKNPKRTEKTTIPGGNLEVLAKDGLSVLPGVKYHTGGITEARWRSASPLAHPIEFPLLPRYAHARFLEGRLIGPEELYQQVVTMSFSSDHRKEIILAWYSMSLEKDGWQRQIGWTPSEWVQLDCSLVAGHTSGDRCYVKVENSSAANSTITVCYKSRAASSSQPGLTGNATNSKMTKETIALLDEWGEPASNEEASAFRFVGYQLKPFCKYEKREANLAELCKNLKEDQISFDEFLGVDVSKLDQKSRWAYQRGMPTVVGSNAAVIYVLRKSRTVTSQDWHHKYHHVAHKDQHGYITRSDGSKIIWMLRPGGLGVLVYPDGGTIFMAFKEVDGLK